MTDIVHTVCMHELAQIVDLDRYPLHEPESAAYATAVAAAREGLRSVGCAVVKDLVRPEAVTLLNNEIVERKHTTHFSTQVMNPYFHTEVNDEFSNDHPVNTFLERSSGFIPGDSWEPGCATDVMFRAPELARFLADCLEIPELHCYADPLAGEHGSDSIEALIVGVTDRGGVLEKSAFVRFLHEHRHGKVVGVEVPGEELARVKDVGGQACERIGVAVQFRDLEAIGEEACEFGSPEHRVGGTA